MKGRGGGGGEAAADLASCGQCDEGGEIIGFRVHRLTTLFQQSTWQQAKRRGEMGAVVVMKLLTALQQVGAA